MSESESERSNEPEDKAKNIQKQYKRKRTKMDEAQKEGKLLFPCQFCLPKNNKIYQSYSALYFHVKQKHPGQKTSSAKKKIKNQEPNPILKLKTILKGSLKQREERQRELIDLKNLVCLKLSQIFLSRKAVEYNQIGEQQTQGLMKSVFEQSYKLSEEIKFSQELFEMAENGQIFRQYPTKIAPVNFGKDIVRYFAKNIRISSKIHFQMILLQSLHQKRLTQEQYNSFQSIIWREFIPFQNHFRQSWKKWKQICKGLASENQQQNVES